MGKSSGGGRNGSSSQLMVAWVSFKGACLERTLYCGDAGIVPRVGKSVIVKWVP